MHHLLHHIFKKESILELPAEALQQCTVQYPYFAAAQYFLSKKLQIAADDGFAKQFQKTLIYFQNPLWLQYQLTEKKAPVKEPETFTSDHQSPSPETTYENHVALHDMIDEVVIHQEAVYGTPEEFIREQISEDENAVKELTGTPLLTSNVPPDSEPERVTTAAPDSRENPVASDHTSPQTENGSITAPQNDAEEKGDASGEALHFQAYHTIDYFASQGIKLNAEIEPGDKLGKQLKSFTAWLKTMRRLPQTTVQEVLEKTSDKEVEQFAAHSLDDNEVVTEAMAEVLAKQGKHQEATDLYRKLSLLNPQKNAYFAAKIIDLKQH